MGTGYILKQGSSGLLSVRLTDAGIKKLSLDCKILSHLLVAQVNQLT